MRRQEKWQLWYGYSRIRCSRGGIKCRKEEYVWKWTMEKYKWGNRRWLYRQIKSKNSKRVPYEMGSGIYFPSIHPHYVKKSIQQVGI